MELVNAIYQRRSIRKYTGEPISEETLRQVLLSGLMSPSSRNLKSAEFIVITDPESLTKLADCKAGGIMMVRASAAIVVIGKSSESDAWIEDSAIAMTQMMLRCTDLGLGSCWIHIRNRSSVKEGITSEEYVRNLLNVPQDYSVLSVLSVGVPSVDIDPHDPAEADFTKVHFNQY